MHPDNGGIGGSLAAQLGPETGGGCYSPCRTWGSQFKRKVKGQYYVSTQDESNSSGSHFIPKAQEHEWVDKWKDSKFAPKSEPLSLGQYVVIFTGFLHT